MKVFKPTPLETFDRLHSQLNVIKAETINVYDNLYAKPTQMGPPLNARHSVVVVFAVSEVLYFGQYDFTEGVWSTLPSDEKMRKFRDRVVQYWFYPPNTIEMFKRYSDDVRGRNRDVVSRLDVSRLDEYNPAHREEWTEEEIGFNDRLASADLVSEPRQVDTQTEERKEQ